MDAELCIAVVVCYGAGSIPFGLLLTKLAGFGDIRNHGSGNIGATNAVRVAGKKIGAAVFLLDALKCTIPLVVFRLLGADELETAAGAAAGVAGHVFPVWLKGKGGKGVSSYAGALAAVSPEATAYFALIWAAVFAWKRISGLAGVAALGLSGALICPLLLPPLCIFSFACCSALCIWRHKQNIRTLLAARKA